MQTGVFRTIKTTGLMLGGLGLFLASPAWGADGIESNYEGEYDSNTVFSDTPANADPNVPKPLVAAENVGMVTDGGQAGCAAPAAPTCGAPEQGCAGGNGSGCGTGCGGGCCGRELGEPWTLM